VRFCILFVLQLLNSRGAPLSRLRGRVGEGALA
jgi:hypothetical protein